MQNYYIALWLHVAEFRVTEEASVAETAVWPITFLVNVFTALKGSVLFSFNTKDYILNGKTSTFFSRRVLR